MKKDDPGVELAVGADRVVSAVPCGVVSIILTSDGTTASTIKLYDHASASSGLTPIKALATKADVCCVVYTPCKSDSFANGCIAVVAGAATAKGYVSIES